MRRIGLWSLTLALGLLATVAVLSAAAAPNAAARRVHVVPIKGIDYHPHRLVIKRGDTVQWRWLDPDTSHTVTSRGGQSFKSSPAMKTGSYRVTFTRPGTYHYACKFHFTMKAEVVVQ